MSINIIIVGAKNNIKNINGLNNPNQAKHRDLLELKKIYKNINIICLDSYDKTYIIDNIRYINEFFELGNNKYFDINSHNIIIEFCNMLNENFINHENNNQNDLLMKYSAYKFTWLSCGCGWCNKFPLNLIKIIIDKEYYTPIDINNIDSYIDTIINTSTIISNNIETIMIPYSQGVYQSLGTILYRGGKSFSSIYNSENILLELFTILQPPLTEVEMIEFNNFLLKNIHWNNLNIKLRIKITKYIYGNNIVFDTQ